MAKASRTEVFDIDINKLYDVIVDFESYPDFVLGVNEIKVHDMTEASGVVEYSIDMIKKLNYQLDMEMSRPNKVAWTFKKGDLFKVNDGGWDLKDLGEGKTEVTYSLEIEVKGFIPGAKMIVNKLTETSLPSMMKSFYERAKN
ncbi:type II toxin-antitoxin system RatA family toxin [Halobacteriovorax sp. RT-2-6]|uniref:type II toxin-antitoxin system RatA family toxin n=1 Tax=unclassified Halobacteriovorax TaxID=2639665 RepID=UPI00399B1686